MTAITQKIQQLDLPFLPDEEERARRRLEKKLRSEAEYFAETIRQKLTQLGICYVYPKYRQKDGFMGVGKKKVSQVDFVRAVGTPEAIYLLVDGRGMPFKTRLSDLNDEDVLDDLSVACRRPVRFRYGTDAGAWYIIERDSGMWGIPRTVKYNDMMNEWPSASRKKLLVPLGIGENRKVFYRSLAEFPHALVGGLTGGGKTTFLHSWICSLIMHNQADELKIALIDLKGGAEFTRYKKLPHLLEDAFVMMPENVNQLLERLQNEMGSRLSRFEQAGGIQNIDIWNYRRRSEKMPRIVLFIDELALVMLNSKLKKKAEPLLADIGARGRAPGVHLVLSTQRPEVKVVSGLIKSNLDARIAFRTTDNPSSQVILDDTSAAKMDEDSPPGRYIFKRGLERHTLQAPMIGPGTIRQIVTAVIEGREITDETKVAPEELFGLSVKQLDGNFGITALYQALGGRVSERYLRELASDYEGEVVDVDGELYQLHPAPGGPIPRMLKPVGEEEEEEEPEPEPEPEPELTDLEIFELALGHLDGDFATKRVYELLDGEVSYNRLEGISQSYEGEQIEIGGELYTLAPPKMIQGGKLPRRLVGVEGGTAV